MARRVIVGEGLRDGDLVIGLASTGIHSNGLTLARRALFDTAGYAVDQRLDDLGRSLGEELLEPTRIYVRPVLALLEAVAEVKALAHITGDGLLNLLRVKSNVGFELTDLPEPPPIYWFIQRAGQVDDAEMYRVFNMGVGYAAVVDRDAADQALKALHGAGGTDARIIGRVTANEQGKLMIPALGLVGTRAEGFVKT